MESFHFISLYRLNFIPSACFIHSLNPRPLTDIKYQVGFHEEPDEVVRGHRPGSAATFDLQEEEEEDEEHLSVDTRLLVKVRQRD